MISFSKWSFASNRSRIDPSELASARADVDRLTHAQAANKSPSVNNIYSSHDHDSNEDIGPSLGPVPARAAIAADRPLGPSLPTASDRQLAVESAADHRKAERRADLKKGYNRADELVPKSGGKEGKMEEKRATNSANKQYREKEVGGLEVDEGTLMGDGDGSSFAAA